MMARDIDFGDKVRNNKAVMFPVVYVHAYRLKCLPLSTQEQLLIYSLDAHEFKQWERWRLATADVFPVVASLRPEIRLQFAG